MTNDGIRDMTWYNERGLEMENGDWHDGNRRALSYCVYAEDKFYICILNANFYDIDWKLPSIGGRRGWHLLIDSSAGFEKDKKPVGGGIIRVPAWSVLFFEVKH